MLPFRAANIGGAVLLGALGAITLLAVPASILPGFPLSAVGWSCLAWALVWLVGEILANGASRIQRDGSQIFREANIAGPSLVGLAGTMLLVAAPATLGSVQIPVHRIGWILLAASLIWLVGETVANGVTRSRRRSAHLDDDPPGPILLS